MRREFLGYQRDFGSAVAAWLYDSFTEHESCDLSHVLVAVPASSARRQLLQSLLQYAANSDKAFLPPEVVTTGTLAESLYRPDKPFASEEVQLLTWATLLQEFHTGEKLLSLVPKAPKAAPLSFWIDLATRLGRLHRELAGDQINFATVQQHCIKQGLELEARRWATLTELQNAYLQRLNDQELWDKQTARLFAVEYHEVPESSPTIVLAGTVDLTQTLRSLISHVPDVYALVLADESDSQYFDETGSLSAKDRFPAPCISHENITFSSDISSTCFQMMRHIASYDGAYDSNNLLIALPNENHIPFVQSELETHGVPNFFPIAGKTHESTPYSLLALVLQFIETQSYDIVAQLVRHTDLQMWLEAELGKDGICATLDKYFNDHLATELTTTRIDEERHPLAHHTLLSLEELAQPIRDAATVSEAIDGVFSLLNRVYGNRKPHSLTSLELHALTTATRASSGLIEAINRLELSISVKDFLDAFMQNWGSGDASTPVTDGVDLRGWLEMPFHSAKAVLVFGANEGVLPRNISGDAFLPDTLRSELGVEDNNRRSARDAYYLNALMQARVETHYFIPTFDTAGDTLLPSRLLLSGDAEDIATRIKAFDAPTPSVTREPATLSSQTSHHVPLPVKSAGNPTKLGVGHFRDYLQCPYRYYLKHVLHLKHIDDQTNELTGLSFGNIVHDLLDTLKDPTYGRSTDSNKIYDHLASTLSKLIELKFGDSPLPAVQMQAISIQHRLRVFAEWQADWVRQGWEIIRTEWPGGAAILAGCDPKLTLDGRIDRLDYNSATGQWMLLDYKAGDRAIENSDIRNADGWKDLQFPMYRHLAAEETGDAPVGFTYLRLSKDLNKKIPFQLQVERSDLEEADTIARTVVENIRNDVFWPPAELSNKYPDDYSWILQDSAFRQVLADPPSLTEGDA